MKFASQFKAKFPIFLIVGLVLMGANYFLGGTSLAVTTGWRVLAGLLAGLLASFLISFAMKRKGIRK